MKKQQHFIKNLIATTRSDVPALPWVRGNRRAAFLAKRTEATSKRKTA